MARRTYVTGITAQERDDLSAALDEVSPPQVIALAPGQQWVNRKRPLRDAATLPLRHCYDQGPDWVSLPPPEDAEDLLPPGLAQARLISAWAREQSNRPDDPPPGQAAMAKTAAPLRQKDTT